MDKIEFTLFLNTRVAELELLEYLESQLNTSIDSLNRRMESSKLFFQYEIFEGDFPIMISLSGNAKENSEFNELTIAKLLALNFKVQILFELHSITSDQQYVLVKESGEQTKINIDDSKDGIYLLR